MPKALDRILESPRAYALSQWCLYRPGGQRDYVTRYVRAAPGSRVLDIGCGPGLHLEYLPEVDYVGYDPNPSYIRAAQARFGRRGDFRAGFLTSPDQVGRERFDVVMLSGVFHHLADQEVAGLLQLAAATLKPNGRLVSRDGFREPHQPLGVSLLLDLDRGHYIRTQEAYRALLAKTFQISRAEVVRDLLRVRYDLIVFECTRAA